MLGIVSCCAIAQQETIPNIWNGNFVFKRHHFTTFDFKKCCDLEIRVKSSLKVIESGTIR